MKTKTNQEWIEELAKLIGIHKNIPFEKVLNSTVLDNIPTGVIKYFLIEILRAKDEQARQEKIELVEYIKNEYGDFSETQCCGDYDLIDYLEEDPKLTQLKAGQEADSERAKSRPEV